MISPGTNLAVDHRPHLMQRFASAASCRHGHTVRPPLGVTVSISGASLYPPSSCGFTCNVCQGSDSTNHHTCVEAPDKVDCKSIKHPHTNIKRPPVTRRTSSPVDRIKQRSFVCVAPNTDNHQRGCTFDDMQMSEQRIKRAGVDSSS